MQNEKTVLVTLDALQLPWCADDAAWFAKNPSRAHRVRPVYPQEFPQVSDAPFVAVRQIRGGLRSRIPVNPIERYRDAPEHIAHAIFDLTCSAGVGEFISTQQVNKRAAELRKAARVNQ